MIQIFLYSVTRKNGFVEDFVVSQSGNDTDEEKWATTI